MITDKTEEKTHRKTNNIRIPLSAQNLKNVVRFVLIPICRLVFYFYFNKSTFYYVR